MTVDPRALAELLEESQDLQADAMRPTHAALDELVELQPLVRRRRLGREPAIPRGAPARTAREPRRCHPLRRGRRRRTGRRARIGGLSASSKDVQVLQTAASIENLAVATYKTALTLPYIGGATANAVVTKFAQVTMGQHAQHADAFNSAVKSLGGKEQTKPDPAFVPVVNKAVGEPQRREPPPARSASSASPSSSRTSPPRPTSRTPPWCSSTSNKALFASIMGIEAQHVAVLLAVQALLKAERPAADLAQRARHRRSAARRRGQRRIPQCLLQDQQCRPRQPRSRQVSHAPRKQVRRDRGRAQRDDAGSSTSSTTTWACRPCGQGCPT